MTKPGRRGTAPAAATRPLREDERDWLSEVVYGRGEPGNKEEWRLPAWSGNERRATGGLNRMTRTRLADLAGWAEGRLHRLIEDAYAAILDRIPVYRRDQLVPAEDLRRSVAHNPQFIVLAIGHPQAPLDLAAPQETGRRRAHQGVPLPEVLQAYRVSFATLWDALVEHVRRSGQPAMADTLLTAASMI